MPADTRAAFEAGLAQIRAPEAQTALRRLNERFNLSFRVNTALKSFGKILILSARNPLLELLRY